MNIDERTMTITGAVVLAVIVAGVLIFFNVRPADKEGVPTEVVVEEPSQLPAEEESRPIIVQEIVEPTSTSIPRIAADMDDMPVAPTATTGTSQVVFVALFGMIATGVLGLGRLEKI